MGKLAAVMAVAAGALLTAGAASACDEGGCARGERFDHRGLELSVQGGAGGHIDDTSTAFSTNQNGTDDMFYVGVGGQAALGYRFLPFMSAGVHFGYQHNPANVLPPGATGGEANGYAVGAYTRFYFGTLAHWGRFDPWIGVGVDPFARVTATYDTPVGQASTRITTVAIPISAGFDVYATRHFAAGLMGQVSPWMPWERCDSNPIMGSTCTSNNLTANTYVFTGLDLRYTL